MMLVLRMMRGLSLLFSVVYLHTLCLVHTLSKKSAGSRDDGTPAPFVFTLQQSCDDWVIFTWDSATHTIPPSGPPRLSSCEITYMDQHSQVAKLVMVVMQRKEKTIRLSTLTRNTPYAASMTCNETITSDIVHFTTGYPCSQEEMKEQADKLKEQTQKKDREVSQRPVSVTIASGKFSVMDMALGVFFAMFGVMIVGFFAYYFWKKHRHRQRIQRIFGQSHTEPFLALHTPSDQPTTSF